MSYKEAELWDAVSFDRWIRNLTNRQNVYDFFRGVIWTLTTIPYPEEISAGEVIITISVCSQEELLEFCRSRLASYKKPARVQFVPELPKNAVGKVLKYVLRERD